MTKEQVGEFIKSKRLSKGMSQQQLADAAGLTRRQHIIEIENAQSDYGIDVLIKILKALDSAISFIVPIKDSFGLLVPSGCIVEESFDFSKVESAKEDSTITKPTQRKKVGKSKNKK